MTRKIHWVCQQPTPYNDYLFKALSSDNEIDLTVHYIDEKLSSHPWKSPLAQGYEARTYRPVIGIDWHLLKQVLTDTSAFFVLGGWHEPTSILLLNILALTGRPFAVWTDAPNLKKPRGRIKGYLREKWLKWLLGKASNIMGTGKLALLNLREMGCPENILVNLPYIVDVNSFIPDSNGKPIASVIGEKTVFLSSGRLVNAHKGYDLAIRALATVKARSGNANFLYRIAGVGPDMEALKSLTKELGLEGQVEFVGWLEQSELPRFYESGDAFLHPAHFEPYGVTVIEAMAAGLIVIGSDQTGAIIDRIVDGQSGFVHRVGDVADLAEKILFFLVNPEIREGMADAAKLSAGVWPASRAVGVIKEVIRANNY